ncbi:MAG: tRNA1(Val) (adenine(37)-N6)-methyltransferase [Desulfovibrionales bacterium]
MRSPAEMFPKGLHQPENGFRFSVDALLLAAFAPGQGPARIADLGTGCGVAGLAHLLLNPSSDIAVVGLDVDEEMIECARMNSSALGLEARFHPELLDIVHVRERMTPESFDCILANPPYRTPGRGRRPEHPGRDRARFESGAGLETFCAAAGFLLKNRGIFCLIHLAERLPHLFDTLAALNLEPKRLRFVHGRMGLAAKLVLVEARKNGGPGITVEPPLILYASRDNRSYTNDALKFCPFLA